MDQPLGAPIEGPNVVSHEDLYKIQVLQGRQIQVIEEKLVELEQKPVVLSNFQKAVLGIFLAACTWVLNTTYQNSLNISAALATLTEINEKVHEAKNNTEVERRLKTLEAAHPRGEPK